MREKVPLETSSLLVLAIITVGFELFPFTNASGKQLHAVDFFSGFGHEALIAVCALMIAGQGINPYRRPSSRWDAGSVGCGFGARSSRCF